MYLGDSDIDNNVATQEKVKADLFESIIGAITIDCAWNQDYIQNSIENMLKIDKFLANINTEEERPEKFKEENAVNTLKELAEHGKCSMPEYDEYNEQIRLNDGRIMWQCTCTVRSWGIQKTAYGISKKVAKKYSAYLVLCEHYHIKNEFLGEFESAYELSKNSLQILGVSISPTGISKSCRLNGKPVKGFIFKYKEEK